MPRTLLLVAFGIAVSIPSVAFSQTKTAYQVGLEVAQRRGYANADCYAKVFVKHAVVVENAAGKRGWFAASTPAYNAEQRSRCGIDRLVHTRTLSSSGESEVFRVGLKTASQRGYSGEKAQCFAKVYAIHASLVAPTTPGLRRYSVLTPGNFYENELFASCGISR